MESEIAHFKAPGLWWTLTLVFFLYGKLGSLTPSYQLDVPLLRCRQCHALPTTRRSWLVYHPLLQPSNQKRQTTGDKTINTAGHYRLGFTFGLLLSRCTRDCRGWKLQNTWLIKLSTTQCFVLVANHRHMNDKKDGGALFYPAVWHVKIVCHKSQLLGH